MHAEFYSAKTGSKPVRDWLNCHPKSLKEIVGVAVEKVKNNSRFYAKPGIDLGGGLFSTKSCFENGFAYVMYCFNGERIVLLHAFLGDESGIPDPEVGLARARMIDEKSN